MSIHYPDRPTFSQRHGRGRRAALLDFEHLRKILARILNDLFRQDRLQEAFGYECVDSGTESGLLGSDPDVFFETRLGFAVWPPEKTVLEMDADQLFDFIEALYDIVSVGDTETGSYHSYGGCGWHFTHFSHEPAQEELRMRLNPLLARLDPPLELSGDGLILELAPDHLRPLLAAALPSGTPHADVAARVNSAVERYQRSRGDINERKAAVRDLVDVLEFRRDQVKLAMLPADEAALFNLANNFAIRHHNRDQRGDYDKAAWLSWAFYVYLATIHAVERVIVQQASPAPDESAAVPTSLS